MPFVQRDALGQICALHLASSDVATEQLPADHPEVTAFLAAAAPGAPAPTPGEFAALDADLIRVLEDLVDVLIQRGVIRVTDLPQEAQSKLFTRKHFRDRMNQHALRLFDEGTPGFDAGPESGFAPPDLSRL